ncbi:MAG TPA: dihydroorotase family protein [Candidatus Limnocylindrales bacterium]|nr:dihydroorotase family protein [Candidatus Limnocylindrales bacterium]
MAQQLDLAIVNGTVVTVGGRDQADLAISDGRIVALGRRHAFDHATRLLDAGGLVLLPGVVDGHVHFRQPGLEHKETWLTGSRAAVHGGVTTVLEMPNTLPPTRSVGDARAKLELASQASYCDFGLFGLVDREGSSAVEELVRSGMVIGLKVFLGPSTGALAAPADEELVRVLRLAARAGLRTAFHAEDAAVLEREATRVGHRVDAVAHLEARPEEAEVRAIDHVGHLLGRSGAAGHILHLSSKGGVDAIRRWRSSGVDLTCEVTPHHLLLGRHDYERLGGQLKANPPVRGEPHSSALLAALAEGLIDCVASDHAPHAPDEKAPPDIRRVEAGVAGVETLLPLMLTLVDDGRLSLERVVDATSAGPARIWGLAPAKGSLERGADADVVLVDLVSEQVVRGAEAHGMHPLTPFEGRSVHGRVVATLVRGRPVVQEGGLLGEPGWGVPVNRA